MKRFICAGVVLASLGLVAANNSSQVQFVVVGALEQLEFEKIPPAEGDPIGGPSKLKITTVTFDHLKKLKDKTIVVDASGRISIQ